MALRSSYSPDSISSNSSRSRVEASSASSSPMDSVRDSSPSSIAISSSSRRSLARLSSPVQDSISPLRSDMRRITLRALRLSSHIEGVRRLLFQIGYLPCLPV